MKIFHLLQDATQCPVLHIVLATFLHANVLTTARGSSVGIVTGYGLDDPGIKSW
jgi:hypothetical protein